MANKKTVPNGPRSGMIERKVKLRKRCRTCVPSLKDGRCMFCLHLPKPPRRS